MAHVESESGDVEIATTASIRHGCVMVTGTALMEAMRRGTSARWDVMAINSDATMASVFLAQLVVLARLSAPMQVMSSSARIQELESAKAGVGLKGFVLLLNRFVMEMKTALVVKMRLQRGATVESVRLTTVAANIIASRMLVGSVALVSLVTGWRVKQLV